MNPRSENPKDEGPYAWQTRDAALQAGKLGINAYAIYCALTHFQSMAATEHKRRFSASYEQLAEHAGCSRGTVKAALDALEKAGLIRKFSGSNGGHRATRNAFFLTSISSPPHGRGSTPRERHVSTRGGRHVSTPHGRFREKENSYSAPPAAAGVTENVQYGRTRQPFGAGSGPQKTEQDLSDLPENVRGWIMIRNAMYDESERLIAEKKKAEEQRNP